MIIEYIKTIDIDEYCLSENDLQLATSKLQVCLSNGKSARCMEHAQVNETRMLYRTSPSGKTLT